MKKLFLLVGLGLIFIGKYIYPQESGEIIITEILYDAASSESTTQTQFIEIANTTNGSVNINNWTIDDEDADGPNVLPNITLSAYEIAVICGSSAIDFQGAFGNTYTVISLKDLGQTMINLKNTPSSTDEIIQLRDALGNLVDEVNYDDANGWPNNVNGFSIYLNLPSASMNAIANNDGTNWALSSNGINGGYSSAVSGVWNAVEISSSGNVNGNSALPVQLSSFSASIVKEGVMLSWQTETEVNNYGFEVERKAPLNPPKGGKYGDWVNIGFVEGHGNSNSPKQYSFVDKSVSSGKVSYRLKQVDNDGSFEYSKIIEIDLGTPLGFELSQNYPNPFNPSTTIKYELPEAAFVKLSVFNILGEEVKVLVSKFQQQGVYSINFNAEGLKSGIYFYKLSAGNFLSTKKMNLIK